MLELVNEGSRLVLRQEGRGHKDDAAHLNYQFASPMLVGLSLPFVVIYFLNPDALAHVRLVVTLGMLLAFVMASVIFVHSVMSPGELTALAFDRSSRIAELVRSGMFATTVRPIPFDQIASVDVSLDYDRDGYPTSIAELTLVNGDALLLPPETSELHVSAIRSALGLAAPARVR